MFKKINQIIYSPFVSLGFYCVAALIFTKYYFLLTNEYYPPAYAEKVANFEADKVFQKRFLVPVAAKFISQNTPMCFDKSLKFVTALSTFGLLYYFNKLLKINTKIVSTQFWCILILIPISWNYMFINSIFHAYDIPTLFFFCICIYLFLNKSYYLFYIVFIIASLNRESTCFIIIFLTLLQLKFDTNFSIKENYKQNSNLVWHLFIQTLIWLVVFLLIRWLTEKSPGQSFETTYSMRIFIVNMLNGSTSWPYLNTETFFGNPRCFLTLFGCSWILIPFLWKYIPKNCKKGLLLIPIFMIPALLYANLMETRVYHELNVVIALAVTSGLIEVKNRKLNINV